VTNLQPMVYTPVSAVANLRRSSLIAAALGALAIVVSAVDGRPLIGVFATLGLALGAINNRMLQRSVIAHGTGSVSKKRFRGGVLGRLGGITVLAVAIALLVRPDGLATFAGLAVFQVLMLVGAAVPVFRSLRPSA
jgi:hypothetical protein